VRPFLVFLALTAASGFQSPPAIQDLTHSSQVLGGDRPYRVALPASYAGSQKRYPVFYWLYGYQQSAPDFAGPMGEFCAKQEIICVSLGPVDTEGAYPLYFPELVEHIDRTLRTLPDRDHRAVSGHGVGGFLALWTAGKYPDLVGSASTLNGAVEAPVGPRGFETAFRNDEVLGNYDGVRILPQARTLEALLEFHGKAFADTQPKPAPFSHADVYPNFMVWGWDVASDRGQPGFTVLENVSARGFRSAVRQWLPDGGAIPEVKLSIASPAKSYPPGSPQAVTYIRLRDGKARRATTKADAQGRLTFELDGDAWEVGVGAGSLLAASGVEFAEGAWATAGKPVSLRVKFWNTGGARSATAMVKWESPDAGVVFTTPSSRIFGLAPGESAAVPIMFTADTGLPLVRIVAVDGANRMPLSVRVFPPAGPAPAFRIADGATVAAYQHGTQPGDVTFGEGNGDGHAAPGETFAVLVPDGEYLRAAELFTNDTCVDNSVRGSDTWTTVTVHYSLPSIRSDCPPGHTVHMLARVPMPTAPPRYYAIEFPVWYRNNQ
jgi:pimeloyl-ACP methyl ester carboxylesterase